MKRSPLPLFYTLTLLVVLALFVTAYLSNRRQYHATLETLSTSAHRLLEREISRMEGVWQIKENDQFKRFEHPARIAEHCLEHNLFRSTKDGMVPAYIFPQTIAIPRAEAEAAFLRGREALTLGDTVNAIEAFETAKHCAIENGEDLYRVVSARINLQDVRADNNPQAALELLALLHAPAPIRLTSTQIDFFDGWLKEGLADYERLRERSDALWTTAARIDQTLQNMVPTDRALIDNRMFSRNGQGMAFLDTRPWTERWQPSPPVRFGVSENDTGLTIPGTPNQHLHLPDAWVADQQTAALSRYRNTRFILMILLFASLLLAYGIARARKKEWQLDALRSDFISTVSHELRTPLSLIQLHAETLFHDRIVPEKRKEYHQTILVEAERLGALVNNVLDFSNEPKEGLKPNREHVIVSELCERVCDSFRFRMEKEGFTFETDIEPRVQSFLDGLGLSQVLFNLLDNAVKYSQDEKNIRFTLKKDGPALVIQVADQGLGIPRDMLKTIFDPFTRGKDQQVTSQRGSGIGLHVAWNWIDAMGGSIEATPNQPNGTLFEIRLPAISSTKTSE